MQAKPSIVFRHGIWADGSGFSNVIPPLQAEGHEVTAAQYGLDNNEGDGGRRGLVRRRSTSTIKRSEWIFNQKGE
jgi:hypothetical protein